MMRTRSTTHSVEKRVLSVPDGGPYRVPRVATVPWMAFMSALIAAVVGAAVSSTVLTEAMGSCSQPQPVDLGTRDVAQPLVRQKRLIPVSLAFVMAVGSTESCRPMPTCR